MEMQFVKANQNVEQKNKVRIPPVDLHWFFEISIRTEKKFQLELKKKIQLVYTEILFQFLLKFFFSF